MSTSPSISLAPRSVAAIVGVAPTAQRSAGDGAAAPESFATALSQASRAPPPSPPPSALREAPPDPAPADAAHGGDDPTPTTDPAAAARAATQRQASARASAALEQKSRANGQAGGAPTAESGPGLLSAPAPDAPAGARIDDAASTEPPAAQLIAALTLGTPPATDGAPGQATPQALGTANVATSASALSRAGGGPAADAPPPAATEPARRGESGAEALAAAGERDTATRPSTPDAAGAASMASSTLAAPATLLPTPVNLLSPAPAGGPAPSVVEARLQASPGSAEFAPALGAQLNVFLRDGVQHARLQLHPAELGPLTVQIQLDGATAQVRLAAEHPLTRQALEQAMPTLAGSLRESGLTLTGGGVFEQPANPQAQQDARGPEGGRTAGARDARNAPAQAGAAPLRVAIARRGVVDLVA